jgi:flavin-binding protein dodecin
MEAEMAESVYTVVELIGTSPQSWEKAAAAAVTQASRSLRDLRVAEVVELDMQLEDGKVAAYRAKVKVSFKYEPSSSSAPKKNTSARSR